jgi:hypothetical protein
MKKITAQCVSILLIFIFSYQLFQIYEKSNSKKAIDHIEFLREQKQIKKVFYANGEYEKELKKWKLLFIDLFEKVSENMNLPLEKVVIQNYIEYAKKYSQTGEELIRIEPTSHYKLIHESLINEAITGAKLCDSYINDINQFDSIFKRLFIFRNNNKKLINYQGK